MCLMLLLIGICNRNSGNDYLDYDRIIANPHSEKKFRENRKFLEVLFDAQSVNLITAHKVYACGHVLALLR